MCQDEERLWAELDSKEDATNTSLVVNIAMYDMIPVDVKGASAADQIPPPLEGDILVIMADVMSHYSNRDISVIIVTVTYQSLWPP